MAALERGVWQDRQSQLAASAHMVDPCNDSSGANVNRALAAACASACHRDGFRCV